MNYPTAVNFTHDPFEALEAFSRSDPESYVGMSKYKKHDCITLLWSPIHNMSGVL